MMRAMSAVEYLDFLSETAFLNALRRRASRGLRLEERLVPGLLRDLAADLDPELLVAGAAIDHFAAAAPRAMRRAA
jgi:hypothetical protein